MLAFYVSLLKVVEIGRLKLLKSSQVFSIVQVREFQKKFWSLSFAILHLADRVSPKLAAEKFD